jgi:Flp pilus assembly protein CpaB
MFRKKKPDEMQPASQQISDEEFTDTMFASPASAPTTKKKSEAKLRSEHNFKMLARIAGISLCLAVAGIGFGIFTVSTTAADKALLESSTRQVVMATTPIPAHTAITNDMVKATTVTNQSAPNGAIVDTADCVGKVTTAAIPANGILSDSDLSGSSNSTLANKLDTGKRAVTIATGVESGLSGMIRQGDAVDIYGTAPTSGTSTAVSKVIVSNATVLALDSNLSTSSSDYASVTVQVSESEASSILGAMKSGTVSLVLHSSVSE